MVNQYCNPLSEPISNISIWTFNVINSTVKTSNNVSPGFCDSIGLCISVGVISGLVLLGICLGVFLLANLVIL
jgi:hypothetical protein